jgi:DNA replication protein DnaC
MPSATQSVPTKTDDLQAKLTALGLRRIADECDDFIARATRKRYSPTQILEEIARLEADERARRSVERRLSRARLGRFKPMADFDWEWPKKIDRTTLKRILTLEFIDKGENVILIAAQGLGKTMIAKNLAYEAVLAGKHARFTSAADLLVDLSKKETARALENRFRHYARPHVLVVDELGYLSYDNQAADLIFQIINRRYEHRSIVVTTNLPFAEWNTVFPHATCTTALIDRLTHHAEILVLEGESYRRREAEITRKARRRDKK